ncbi:MAG: hypothetical protein GY805_37445 [Chloroflexi bacterium]|nr:hypothetical protein [Chloroflexota bacterium]
MRKPQSLIPSSRQTEGNRNQQRLSEALILLREWQSQRLATTHQDLLQHKQFGSACRFFLTDVYAPQDFSDRDDDILHVYQAMKRIMPAPIMRTLKLVIALNELTNELDNQLLQVMVDELQLTDRITAVMYASAYRLCDNYEDRLRQIELIVSTGQSVNRLVRLPFVGLTLRLAHTPAHLSGWADLQSFLERGFSAFKQAKNVALFLETVSQREKKILKQIYAGDDAPFTI